MRLMPERLRRGFARALSALRISVRTAAPLFALGAMGALGTLWMLAGLGAVRPAAAWAGEPVVADERPATAPALEEEEADEIAPEVLELSSRYRGVFWTLASGDRSAALQRAAALEMQALAAHPREAMEWLTQADGRELGTLLTEQPDCALPLALFYQQLVVDHATHQRYGLTQRALRVTDGILERMAVGAGTEGERRLAADAYSGFAADLLTVPAPARAAEVLGRGLPYAPDDADINIALAILLLRDRRPQDAEERLDHVLRTQPEHREARLRRALMRNSASADGRAGRELEKLATAGENDWIALVAAQERVRRLLATGDYGKSIEFLNRVLERFPTDSSLRTALAFAAARSGRRAEAFLASQAALAAKAPAGEGARRRFSELPTRLLLPQAARAEAAAEARIPSLAAALSGTAPKLPATPAAPAAASPAAAGLSR
ncbi:MAG: hypothetical protein KBF21_09505 [Thermoanaerobaculia bacterium]|nr:hypothetical protein [Thermoanaerobaculia bacterium]MBP9824445.1 hypothetical protein [Thermoanaerobaculia bacterium]